MSVNQRHHRVKEEQQQSGRCPCTCYYYISTEDMWLWFESLLVVEILLGIAMCLFLLILHYLPLEKLLAIGSRRIAFLRRQKLTDQQRHFLEENVQVEKIMTKLLSAMLVDDNERKQIEKEATEREKTEVLLQIIELKEQEEFDRFLDIFGEVYPAFSLGKAMSVKHRTALISCRDLLVNDLSVSQILSGLYSRGILDKQDKEAIEAKSTPSEKAEKLLDILPSKPDDHFEIFCDVLSNNKSESLADTLIKASAGTCESNATTPESVTAVRTPSVPSVSEEDCLPHKSKKNKCTRNKQKNNELLFHKLRSKFQKTLQAFIDTLKRFRRSLRSSNSVDKKDSVGDKSTKTSTMVTSQKFIAKTSSKNVHNSPGIAQTKWILTHLETQISSDQALASLKKVCDVSYIEGKPLEKGDINDLMKNLDSETFAKFLETLNEGSVITKCPKFADALRDGNH